MRLDWNAEFEVHQSIPISSALSTEHTTRRIWIVSTWGMGSDVVHAGLNNAREERSVNGTLSESRLDPACAH